MSFFIWAGSKFHRFFSFCLFAIFCVGCGTTSKDMLEIGDAQLESGITLNSKQRITIYPKTSGKVFMIGHDVQARNIDGKLLVIDNAFLVEDGRFIVFDMEEVKKVTLSPRPTFLRTYAPGYSELYPDDRVPTQDDYKIVYRWYQHAADQGDPTAMANLGLMYAEGRGVARDYLAAFEWYELAAGYGGRSTQLDFLYTKAKAQQGHAQAQYDLSIKYQKGLGVRRELYVENWRAAFKWNKLAAQQGHAEAQVMLCERYFKGRASNGVSRDLSRAYMWCHIAASHGNEEYVRRRDEIREYLDDRHINKGLELARECLDSRYRKCQ